MATGRDNEQCIDSNKANKTTNILIFGINYQLDIHCGVPLLRGRVVRLVEKSSGHHEKYSTWRGHVAGRDTLR